MNLIDGDEEIETIPAQDCDQALAEGIGLGRAEWSLEDPDSHISDSKIQLLGADPVSVVKQESIALFVAHGCPKLLQGPSGIWMGSNIEMKELSHAYFQDDKHVDQAESDCAEAKKSQATIAFA